MNQVVFFSPSGALIDETLLDKATLHLRALGFQTREMPEARLREQRFAGNDSRRIQSILHACSISEPSVLMATRGGYGLSRLLDQLDFNTIAQALQSNRHVLCGHSDITGLQLALLAAGAPPQALLHGPMACFDFGVEDNPDPVTVQHFKRAVQWGEVSVQWQADDSGDVHKAVAVEGPVWGGNLSLLCSLLNTPWMPEVEQGVLILEDVNEPVYKIERMLLQLLHAGVLDSQQAVVLGNFAQPQPNAHDNGYNLEAAARYLQSKLSAPVITGFPFGHCTPKSLWFQGLTGELNCLTDGRCHLIQVVR